ncbi:MAG: sulfoxide reductase heme-binding subunit YedZ [Anaerolineales bacterium]|nr:sulfoxide reductase heme-binding subunit YedZ [Anaerolineales bacterium]
MDPKRVKVRRKARLSWLQVVIHILGWLPLAWIIVDFLTANLTINPIQEVTQRLGRSAAYFLIASLACTPLNTLFGWREMLKRRRALGLYAFLYASLHALMFIGVDYGFSLNVLNEVLLTKPYALMGMTAFLILVPLAITSFKWFMKKMGRGWTSLHRLVYLAAVVDVAHYAWAKKGNLLTLSGDILKPLILGLLLILLLVLRIPVVRKWISGLRQRFKARGRPSPAR